MQLKGIWSRTFYRLDTIRKNIPCARKSFLKTFLIFFDVRHWQKCKKMLFCEYFQFRFYGKTQEEREAYVLDNEVMNDIPNAFNDINARKYLDEKPMFNSLFSDFLGRSYLLLEKNDFNSFCCFVKKEKKVIIKPLDGMCGRGVHVVDENSNLKEEFENATSVGKMLVEEVLTQNSQMKSLNPDCINTIRVVTMRNANGKVNAPLANIRIGRKGACVDNFCAGGMTASINMETGKVSSKAFDGAMNEYEFHPDSGIRILGFQIPLWNEIIDCVKKAADLLPRCRYIGWDVMIDSNDRVCLIEGNSNPEARIFQIPAQKGLRDVYYKYLGRF